MFHPIGSMYGIFTYIYRKINQTIHGSYGHEETFLPLSSEVQLPLLSLLAASSGASLTLLSLLPWLSGCPPRPGKPKPANVAKLKMNISKIIDSKCPCLGGDMLVSLEGSQLELEIVFLTTGDCYHSTGTYIRLYTVFSV